MLLPSEEQTPPIFPVVCIGGSAGSLSAYLKILRQMPGKLEMAVVVVSHRATVDAGRFLTLLGMATHMEVVEATDGMPLECGRIFVAPPHMGITTDGVALRVADPAKSHGWPILISEFLISLAKTCHSRAIAIILSGLGYDGSGGLAAVKKAGGWTLAQSDAQYLDMPQAAIDTEHIDFVLRAREIGRYLASLNAHLAQKSA